MAVFLHTSNRIIGIRKKVSERNSSQKSKTWPEKTKPEKTRQEVSFMKGYSVDCGYMGLVAGRYMLFATEDDYREYMEVQQY